MKTKSGVETKLRTWVVKDLVRSVGGEGKEWEEMQKAGVMFNDLRLLFIQVRIRNLRLGKRQRDLFSGKPHISRLHFAKVHARFDDSMRNQNDACVIGQKTANSVLRRILLNHHLLHHVFDCDQFRKGLHLLQNGRSIVNVPPRTSESSQTRQQNSDYESYRENNGQHQNDDCQPLFHCG